MFPVSMAHQRDRLFAALGDVVARVDDLDALVPILQQLGRDHRKFGTLAAHYPAVGGEPARHAGALRRRVDPRARQGLDRGLHARRRGHGRRRPRTAEEQPAWWDADVVAHDRRTIDVAVLQVRPRHLYDYQAGQSVSLETDLRPRLWRYYSPANAPRPDGLLEIHVKARDGGPVSSALVRRVGVGDVLRLGPPLGHLTLHADADRDLLLVAGGMGLAPLKALIDQVARKGPARRVDLFAGFRTEDRHLRPRRPRAPGEGEPVADGHLRRVRRQDLGPGARGGG